MTNLRFNKEQQLLNHLVLHSNDTPTALGLLNGQMGIAIVLADYARKRNFRQIEKVADELMDNILKRLTKTTSISFADGLCGIGWGIEYLIQNGIIKGCGADILQDVDKKIMEYDILRLQDLSLEIGLEGILHYVLVHLQGANKDGREVFDNDYLRAWVIRKQKLYEGYSASQSLKELLGLLEEGINGNRHFYEFNLLQFIQTRYNKKTLSLKEGTAGQLEVYVNKTLNAVT